MGLRRQSFSARSLSFASCRRWLIMMTAFVSSILRTALRHRETGLTDTPATKLLRLPLIEKLNERGPRAAKSGSRIRFAAEAAGTVDHIISMVGRGFW